MTESRLQHLLLVEIDWQTGEVTLRRDDGMVGTATLPDAQKRPDEVVRKGTWSPPLNVFVAETAKGDYVGVELPTFPDSEHLAGRAVVYLDQCIWRTLANTRREPARVRNPPELAAAEELIALVQARKVVLPVSAAHHSETTRWTDNERRYQLGLTMVELSRGWTLRDPLTLRREELRAGLRRHVGVEPPPSQSAFTLDQAKKSRESRPLQSAPDLPPEMQFIVSMLTSTTVMISVILDAEPIEWPPATNGWLETNRRFSAWLDSETRRTPDQKRKSVDVMLLHDLGQEIAEEAQQAGLRPAQMSSWVRGPMFRDMDGLPSVGIYRGVLHQRHLNIGTRWRANDLTDMIYLSAAVGYADVVVAENHMTAMINQAQRLLTRSTPVFRSLASALPTIRDIIGSGHAATDTPSTT